MKRNKIETGWSRILSAAMLCACAWAGTAVDVQAQSASNYTNTPLFLNKSAPPNILFLVDTGNATLEAAYAGSNHWYPLSYKLANNTLVTPNDPYYASNVNVNSLAISGGGNDNTDLRAVDLSNTVLASATVAAPADLFNPNKKYYGIFDPFRCYTVGANTFTIGTDADAVKGAPTTNAWMNACTNATKWDGNFLNWLTMRKQEIIYKVLVGGSGHTTPAQANQDGTANSLAGESKTGENGVSTTCGKTGSVWNACWRYVKYVPAATLTGRVPNTLPSATVNLDPSGTVNSATNGVFFGIDGGKIYVNDNATASPFDTASGNQYTIKVDLTSEPDVPSGSGSFAGTCPDPTDPAFAGHRVCYQREQSLGLFQTLNTSGTSAHLGVMLINASTGQGGSLFFGFDDAIGSSVYATLRNESTFTYSPLAESLYEALCLFNKASGPCYNNGTGSWKTGYNSSVGVAGDPFYFVTLNQTISCCKNYVLMISPGIGAGDGNSPDLVAPFPVGSTIAPTYANNVGIKATTVAGDAASADIGDRLDDVAYYGHTHDVRTGMAGTQIVNFYGVNAMGRQAGAQLLASAAKYGGFDDKNKDGQVALAGTQSCTYPTGSNLGTGSSTSNPEWDGTNGAPDCVPDTFFDASDGESLVEQIQAALNDIMKKSASGTSISVLASSSSGEGSIYQAFFYPETVEDTRTVRWTGHMQGLFIDSYGNLREDRGGASGGPDGKLVYTDDNIVVTELDPISGDVIVRGYADGDGDGKADDPGYYATPRTGGTVTSLRNMQGIWEAGKKLAKRDLAAKPRNLFTWVDLNNDGIVTASEQIAFTTANAATLAPYLRSGVVINPATSYAPSATNIIDFLHGNQPSGMRERQLTIDGDLKVWRLGDIINSSPTIAGPPRERFDILYGDTGYRLFLRKWAHRRQVAYVGANDGMLHAFNVGHYNRGDNPSTPLSVEHGWYSDNEDGTNIGGAEPTTLGEELWGFVPYYTLPQLGWYTDPAYAHISYVDLKPKVTDVKIFTPEPACGSVAVPTPTAIGCIHPDGWGTILIMGMRYGGSCGWCQAKPIDPTLNGGPPLQVVADFNNDGDTTDPSDTRIFYSGYVVLDITDPDATPKVLSAFSHALLGLTTSYPTVVRTSPAGDGKNDHTNAKWLMVMGSGANGYDGHAIWGGYASIFGARLVEQGQNPSPFQLPVLDAVTGSSMTYRDSYMGDLITYDRNLDFRSDAVYGGRLISGNPVVTASSGGFSWNYGGTGLGYLTGKMERLTMGTCTTAPCSVMTWGVTQSGWILPTEIVASVPISAISNRLGPVLASPGVTLDDAGNTWLFFGTGRFMSIADKTDDHAQYLVGVKDSVVSGTCTQTSTTSCTDENLLDVTNAAICISCASGNQVQGVGTISTFSNLVTMTKSSGVDGWVIQLASNASSPTLGAERSIVSPTVIGGAVFFPTFTPSSDVCVATGTSQIYGLYYLTGTGYTDPIFGVDGSGKAVRSISGGQGVASSVAIQIGAEPTGMSGFFQSSNSAITKMSPKAPMVLWSQFMAWIDVRT